MKPPQLGFGFALEGDRKAKARSDYNEYHRGWRAKNSARLKAERMALYASREEAGTCPICGHPRDIDALKLCGTCTNKRDKKKLAAKQQTLRIKRKTAGMCVTCGKNKADDGKTFCRPCLVINNVRTKRRYRERMAAGLCERVGCSEPVVSGQIRCLGHKLHKNAQRREKYTPEWGRKGQLKAKFGLTPEQWDMIFDSQGRCCAICASTTPQTAIGWATDHDHATGRVRGILCNRCNPGLGSFRDDIDILSRAIEYLRKHRLTLVV